MRAVSSPSPLGTGPTHVGASSVPTRSGAAGEQLAQWGRGTARTVVARERQWMMGGGLRGESHHPAPRACSHASSRPGHAVMVSSLARSPQPATSWGKLGATSHERNRPWAPRGATRRRRDTAPNAEPPLDIAAAPPHRLASGAASIAQQGVATSSATPSCSSTVRTGANRNSRSNRASLRALRPIPTRWRKVRSSPTPRTRG